MPVFRSISLFLLAITAAGAVDLSKIPKPTGYVSDLAHVLSASDQAGLEVFCFKVQQQLGAQFAIVTIPSLDGQPIEDFSIDLARKWGIGPKTANEGLLILLVINDHKRRIEVGRGLEPYITDAIAGDTGRAMVDQLRKADYGDALTQAVRTLAAKIADGKQIAFSETTPRPATRPQDNSSGIPWPFIVFAAIFLLIFILNRRGGGGRGSGVGTGFWTGMVVNSMLNSGRSGGSSWGGGGGFGGGSDSGGGGGGGFGGFGGGDFGGGGASGDW